MENTDHLNTLIVDIGERAGLPLQLDTFGSCAIQYDEISEIVLTSCDSGATVLLHSPLTYLCEQRPLEHLRHCMEITIYGAETDGGAVGLDPESRAITFWRRIALQGLDSHALESAIITFITASEKCRVLLRNRHAGIETHENETVDMEQLDHNGESEHSFATHANLMRI